MNYSQEALQLMNYLKAPEYVKFGEHVAVCPYRQLFDIYHNESRSDLPEWMFDGVKEELEYQWLRPNAVIPKDETVISEEELVAFLKYIDWHGKIICETYPWCEPLADIYEHARLDKIIEV